MERKNPALPFSVASSLPNNPFPGMSRHLAGIGSFVWDGARWVGIDGSTYFHAAGAGLLVREPVIVIAGVATRANALVHERGSGICVGLLNGLAAVRYSGLVGGFEGLVAGAQYHVGAAAGVLTNAPVPANAAIIPMGMAISDSEFFVRTGPEFPA